MSRFHTYDIVRLVKSSHNIPGDHNWNIECERCLDKSGIISKIVNTLNGEVITVKILTNTADEESTCILGLAEECLEIEIDIDRITSITNIYGNINNQ